MKKFPFCIPTEHYTAEDINEFFKWCEKELETTIIEVALYKGNEKEYEDEEGDIHEKGEFKFFGVDSDNESYFWSTPCSFEVDDEIRDICVVYKSIKQAKKHLGDLK